MEHKQIDKLLAERLERLTREIELLKAKAPPASQKPPVRPEPQSGSRESRQQAA